MKIGWKWVLLLLGLAAVSCHTPGARHATGLPIRIALMSDLHIVSLATNDQQRLYPLRLARAIDAVNAAKVDLVLVAGDLTEHGTAAEFALFKQQMRRLDAPVFFVPGNHDVGNKVIPGGKKDAISFGRLRNFQLDFGRSFFVREQAGVRVIGLNSCLFGSRGAQERQMWDMLERQLAGPSPEPTFLLMHHPPFLRKVDEPGGDYFNMEPYPRARLLALAQQGGVEAILSGHLHHGLTNDCGRLTLLTTTPVAFGLPANKAQEGWTLLSIDGTNLTWTVKRLPRVRATSSRSPATAP